MGIRSRPAIVAASVLGAVALAWAALPPAGELRANEDISNYDGTACDVNQFYDATGGNCTTDTSANNPSAPPMDLDGLAADLVSLSDTGSRCSANEFYSVTSAMCWPEVVTNDPNAPVVLEGENPPPPPVTGPATVPKPAAP